MINCKVAMIKTPQASPGFLGEGHIAVNVVDGAAPIRSNQIAWLDKPPQTTDSYLKVKGSHASSIFVLYAAQLNVTISSVNLR